MRILARNLKELEEARLVFKLGWKYTREKIIFIF